MFSIVGKNVVINSDKDSVIIGFGSLSFLGDLMSIVENNRMVRSDTHGK